MVRSPYRIQQEIDLEGTEVRLFSGVMGSGKTAALINLAEQLTAKGKEYIILKPELDTRTPTIWSRDGRTLPCEVIGTQLELAETLKAHEGVEWILVDESQFFSPDFIKLICVDGNYHGYKNICFYSLKTDFMDNTFEAWKEITRYADKWHGLECMCEICHKQVAVHNHRCSGGDALFEVGTDNYKSICVHCNNELTKANKKRGTK